MEKRNIFIIGTLVLLVFIVGCTQQQITKDESDVPNPIQLELEEQDFPKDSSNIVGQAGSGPASVSVNPESITSGSPITISINAPTGVYKKGYVYKSVDGNRGSFVTYIDNLCSSYRCTGEFTTDFTLPSYVEAGDYQIHVLDYSVTSYSSFLQRLKSSNVFTLEAEGIPEVSFEGSLSSTEVNIGEELTFSADSVPGEGVYKLGFIFIGDSGFSYLRPFVPLCTSHRCTSLFTANIDTSSLEAGNYRLGVYDFSETNWRDRWKMFPFSVVESGTVEFEQGTDQCQPLIYNGNVDKKFNFVFAFYGLSQEEINEKGSDIVRAQFYRSEYDHTDSDFGFTPGKPNSFETRAGIFEIEPFRSHLDKFNVFYLNIPIPDDVVSGAEEFVSQDCFFLDDLENFNDYQLIVFKHKDTLDGGYWRLEYGYNFNHEIGHTFGLVDGYYYNLGKNDLTPSEVTDWNERLPNCDYGKPSNEEGYLTGEGYCTKWCSGVNPGNYAAYLNERNHYDQCIDLLNIKDNEEEWLNFCTSELNFNGHHNLWDYYTRIFIDGSSRTIFDLQEGCELIYADSESNPRYENNKKVFCYAGSLYNTWDLNIGENCMEGTGCYAGCGGQPKSFYYDRQGAFGDAFRPHKLGIMGGNGYPDAGSTLSDRIHADDEELPSFDPYEIQAITEKFDELGLE